jgi:hypothetical protein
VIVEIGLDFNVHKKTAVLVKALRFFIAYVLEYFFAIVVKPNPPR